MLSKDWKSIPRCKREMWVQRANAGWVIYHCQGGVLALLVRFIKFPN